MTARIIDEAELREEARQRTVKCHCCMQWIRYTSDDRVIEVGRRYLVCPGCGEERTLALGAGVGL